VNGGLKDANRLILLAHQLAELDHVRFEHLYALFVQRLDRRALLEHHYWLDTVRPGIGVSREGQCNDN
jgi:hypothetical protein